MSGIRTPDCLTINTIACHEMCGRRTIPGDISWIKAIIVSWILRTRTIPVFPLLIQYKYNFALVSANMSLTSSFSSKVIYKNVNFYAQRWNNQFTNDIDVSWIYIVTKNVFLAICYPYKNTQHEGKKRQHRWDDPFVHIEQLCIIFA